MATRREPFIHNNTHYRTSDLKAFVVACLKADDRDLRYSVTVDYTKGESGASGCAYLNSRTLTVRVPKGVPTTRSDGWTFERKRKNWHRTLPSYALKDLAGVLVHELAHCDGIEHDDMHPALKRGTSWMADKTNEEADAVWRSLVGTWWEGLEIRAKAGVIPDDVPPLVAAQAARKRKAEQREKTARSKVDEIDEKLKKLESQRKRLMTLKKKWREKVAYYDRKAAQSPPRQ